MKYELYGTLHRTVKKILKRSNDLPDTVKLVSFPEKKADANTFRINNARFINEKELSSSVVEKADVYPVENLVNSDFDTVYPLSFRKQKKNNDYTTSVSEAVTLWPLFIDASKIEAGYRNAGIHYGGYIKDCQEWCLPSWMWTNAALVRYYCSIGLIDEAKGLFSSLHRAFLMG